MTITTEFNFDTNTYELWCVDGRMRAMPAGARLFRGEPPDIQFQHLTQQGAETDAAKLRKYLAALEGKKAPTKKQEREMEV